MTHHIDVKSFVFALYRRIKTTMAQYNAHLLFMKRSIFSQTCFLSPPKALEELDLKTKLIFLEFLIVESANHIISGWRFLSKFLFDTLYTIHLKAFYFSTAPAGIPVSLLFSEACRSSLTQWILIILVVSFLMGILSFLIPCLTCSFVVDLIITWSILHLAPLIARVQKVWQNMLLCDNVADEVSVFGS